MGKFDMFNWWKRGVTVTSPIKKIPKGSGHPLVWHQIMHGDFRPSPYWEMSNLEIDLFNKEIEDYKKKKPYSSKEAIEEWSRSRWSTYHKRIEKLKEAHIEYEQKRISLLKKGLLEAFDVDIWEESLRECQGDEMDLYEIYKKKSSEINGQK
jgi:hypothetical protein